MRPLPAPGVLALPRILALFALLASCALPTPSALAESSHQAAPQHPADPHHHAASAPSVQPHVLFRLPHDPKAFTQGLLLRQGAFFESTGLYGLSSLRRVNPATGRVLARRALPARLFGEGLALCPDEGEGARPRLVQLTWREGAILAYDPDTLRLLARRPLRGQGWGLACQGQTLWLSDGTDALRRLDAQSLAETGEALAVRDADESVERLNELEWVNGWLLANVWGEDRIAAIRPDTGQVALWLDLSALRRELSPRAEAANGIAFGPETARAPAPAGQGTAEAKRPGVAGETGKAEGPSLLYLTGKRWEKVFAVELPELLRQPPASQAR